MTTSICGEFLSLRASLSKPSARRSSAKLENPFFFSCFAATLHYATSTSGDSSNAIAAKNKNAGAIPVPKRIWDVITATAAKA